MLQAKPQLVRGSAKTANIALPEVEVPTEPVKPRLQKSGAKIFLVYWLLVFFAFFGVLYSLGLVPDAVAKAGEAIIAVLKEEKSHKSALASGVAENVSSAESTPVDAGAYTGEPRLLIDDIGVDTAIVFPESTDLNVLNTALTKGAVYYPGSGELGETGNVFLFGHSTGLKVVYNKNYEVFNRLKELEAGDMVRVQSGGREYWYRMLSMTIQKADDANINLSTSRKLLTISTCRIFGGKEDRYVVEAEFVTSYPLAIL